MFDGDKLTSYNYLFHACESTLVNHLSVIPTIWSNTLKHKEIMKKLAFSFFFCFHFHNES